MIKESKLLFIISQPRAGSTLTQKLLSNNSLVDTVSEPWLLLPLLSIYRPDLINAKYNYPLALDGLFDYLKKKQSEVGFKGELKKVILNLYEVHNEHQYFIDKTPRYYEILPEIIHFFPGAKYLVLKRNPFASLHSMLSIWAGGKIEFKSLRSFYRDFLIAPFLIQDFCDQHGSSSNVFEVKYEDIVSNPEFEVKKIYQWLDIPFTPAVLNIAGNEKVKGIYGDDAQRKTPLNTIASENSEAWKNAVLPDRTLSFFFDEYQKFLSVAFIRRYGYDCSNFEKETFRIRQNLFQDFLSDVKLSKATRKRRLRRIIRSLLRKIIN